MRTDITKLTVTFSNSANAPKNVGNNDLMQGTIFDPLYLAKRGSKVQYEVPEVHILLADVYQ